jgi:uncharacterized membrane protein
MRRTIIAVYDDAATGHRVVDELVKAGIERNHIGFAMQDREGKGEKYLQGVVDDTGFGALVGGLTGLLVGLGALMVPGIGPVLAAGPLISALTGTAIGIGAGAVTGGIVGGLVDLGVPEEEASAYAEAIRRGSTLVTATVQDTQLDTATRIMQNYNPVDMDTRITQWRAKGWETFDPMIDTHTAEDIATGHDTGTEATPTVDTGKPYQSANLSGTTQRSSAGASFTPRAYSSGYDQWHDDFYRHYQQHYAGQGDYLAFMPAYRQGYYMGSDTTYANRKWDEIEPDARQYWERGNYTNAWDEIKDAVRYAWEKVKDAVGAE